MRNLLNKIALALLLAALCACGVPGTNTSSSSTSSSSSSSASSSASSGSGIVYSPDGIRLPQRLNTTWDETSCNVDTPENWPCFYDEDGGSYPTLEGCADYFCGHSYWADASALQWSPSQCYFGSPMVPCTVIKIDPNTFDTLLRGCTSGDCGGNYSILDERLAQLDCSTAALCIETLDSAAADLPEGLQVAACPAGQDCPHWIEINAAAELPNAVVSVRVAGVRGPGAIMELENAGSSTMAPITLQLVLSETSELTWQLQTDSGLVIPNLDDPFSLQSTLPMDSSMSYCLELEVAKDTDEIRVWLDDRLVPGLELDGNPQTGFDAALLAALGGNLDIDLESVKLGWVAASGASTDFHQVAVTSERFGCRWR